MAEDKPRGVHVVEIPELKLPRRDGFVEGWEVGFRRGLQRAVEILETDLASDTQLLVLQAESQGKVVGLLDGRLVVCEPVPETKAEPLPELPWVKPPEPPAQE